MALGQTEEFSLDGAWWRLQGSERVEATKPPEEAPPVMGLDEGLRFLTKDVDPLLGRDAENPCYATLEFSPSKTLRLKLLGASDRVFGHDETDYVVHGYDANGSRCTLLDCFTGPSTVNGGMSGLEVVGHLLVHGAHVGTLDELRFQRAELRLSALREFLSKPLPSGTGGLGAGIAEDDGMGERVVQIAGAKFKFELILVRTRAEYRDSVESQGRLRIELDAPASYSEWQDTWVQPLLDLLRFATREPARVESFVAVLRREDSDATEQTGNSWPTGLARQDVEFVVPKSDLLYDQPRHGYRRMLLSSAAVGDGLETLLVEWWALNSKLGRAATLLFAVLQRRGFADSRLVTLASVAEAYHRVSEHAAPIDESRHSKLVEQMLTHVEGDHERRVYGRRLRHANSYTQEERIQRVIARAGVVVPELARKSGRLAARIAATRNDLVHLPVEEEQPLHGVDLVEAGDLLVLALQANLLLDLGIRSEHATLLVAASYGQQMLWSRLRRRGHAWPKGG
jgi:hypothetical protein